MKMTTMIAAMALALGASAATPEELNKIPVKDIKEADIPAAFDAALAVSNYSRCVLFVVNKKVDINTAAAKYINAKVSYQHQNSLLRCNWPAATNMTARASMLEAMDFTSFADEVSKNGAYYIISYPNEEIAGLRTTPEGFALLKKIYAVDKPLAMSLACRVWSKLYSSQSPEMVNFCVEAYNACKTEEKLTKLEWATMLNYAWYGAKDYAWFEELAKQKKYKYDYNWIYVKSSRPEAQGFNAGYIDYLIANVKPRKRVSKVLCQFAKVMDKAAGNKNASAKIFSHLHNSAEKLNVALYLNDADKIISTFAACDMSLTAKDIEAALPAINALDPNYKPAEVMTALKAVNQRYTLKLYDDRDTWEPVLSKIRAMIDCR